MRTLKKIYIENEIRIHCACIACKRAKPPAIMTNTESRQRNRRK